MARVSYDLLKKTREREREQKCEESRREEIRGKIEQVSISFSHLYYIIYAFFKELETQRNISYVVSLQVVLVVVVVTESYYRQSWKRGSIQYLTL